jgi:hypothetical protein
MSRLVQDVWPGAAFKKRYCRRRESRLLALVSSVRIEVLVPAESSADRQFDIAG